MMADSNGWTDEREEEREALDQLDMTLATAPVTRRRLPVLRGLLPRAAAREILALRMNRKGSGAGSPLVYVRSPMRRASRRKALAVRDTSPIPPVSTRRTCIAVWGSTRQRVGHRGSARRPCARPDSRL